MDGGSTSRRSAREWAWRLLPLAAIGGLAALVFAQGWHQYLSMDMIREHGLALKAYAQANWWTALAVFVAVYALATASTIPGPVFLTLLGGLMFGPYVGALAQATGATLGSVAIYLIYRTALGTWLRRRFAERAGLMDRIAQGLDRNAFVSLLTLRLIPSVPFVLINACAGMMAVPLRPYVAATFLGLLPSTFLYTWIGAGLGDMLRAGAAPDLDDLPRAFFWPLMGVAFLSLLLPLGLRIWQVRRARRAAAA